VTSAIRLGSRGDSYYEYLLYVSTFVDHMRRGDSSSQETVHSDSAFHVFDLGFMFIFMDSRIEQRAFIARHVDRRVTTPSCLTAPTDV
jgi:hypothetical protein